MRWKDSAEAQFKFFREIKDRLGATTNVFSDHFSKSIKLPVVTFYFHLMKVHIRGNFDDWNLCVEAGEPPKLTARDVFGAPRDWDWYLDQIARCEGYSWKEWTQEELEDERISRVKATARGGKTTYWNEKKFPEKERWLKRFESPEWYARDWSSSEGYYEGECRPGCELYLASKCFLQGMHFLPSEAHRPWRPGFSQFAVCLQTQGQVVDFLLKLQGRKE
jgi:hypothetical protein